MHAAARHRALSCTLLHGLVVSSLLTVSCGAPGQWLILCVCVLPGGCCSRSCIGIKTTSFRLARCSSPMGDGEVTSRAGGTREACAPTARPSWHSRIGYVCVWGHGVWVLGQFFKGCLGATVWRHGAPRLSVEHAWDLAQASFAFRRPCCTRPSPRSLTFSGVFRMWVFRTWVFRMCCVFVCVCVWCVRDPRLAVLCVCQGNNNDLWLRRPTFNYNPPYTWPGWYQNCNFVTGSTGIYACAI
jgi:hypothetical protein